MPSIIKSDLPTDLSQWEEMEIVEEIGSSEEHADKFYRYDNYGIEVHEDGLCQAYVIIQTEEGEEPIMVAEGFDSPEAVIEYFEGQEGAKELVGDSTEEDIAEESDEPVSDPDDPVVEAEIIVENTDPKEEEKMKKSTTTPESEKVAGTPESDTSMNGSATVTQQTPTDLGAAAPVAAKTDSSSAVMASGEIHQVSENPVAKSDCGEEEKEKEECCDESVAKSDAVASSGDATEALNSGSSPDLGPDNIAMAQETPLQGTSTEDKDGIAQAKPTALPSADTSEGTQSSMDAPRAQEIYKSFRDMMASREMATERGLPHGVVSRTGMTINKSINKAQYRANRYPTTYIGSDKDATGYLAGYKVKTSESNDEGVGVKTMKSADEMSFADMMRIRKGEAPEEKDKEKDKKPEKKESAPAEAPAGPGPEAPPMDPAAMGGAPPMDPAMGGPTADAPVPDMAGAGVPGAAEGEELPAAEEIADALLSLPTELLQEVMAIVTEQMQGAQAPPAEPPMDGGMPPAGPAGAQPPMPPQ